MPKILQAAIVIAILSVLSQFARTSTETNRQKEQARLSTNQHETEFRLKQSYPIDSDSGEFLATIYSCGTGAKQKEILSIWSRESNAYELQYIRTAAAGQTFKRMEIFSNKKLNFIKISTLDQGTGKSSLATVLSVSPESNVTEIQNVKKKHFPARN